MPDVLDEELIQELSFENKGADRSRFPALMQGDESYLMVNANVAQTGSRIKRNKSTNTPALTTYTAAYTVGYPLLNYMKTFGTNIYSTNTINVSTHQTYRLARGPSTDILTGITNTKPTGLVASNLRIFRLCSTGNVQSWLDTDLAMTDEGDTNSSFPRGINAIWLAQFRMLAITNLASGSYAPDLVFYSASNNPQSWDRAVNAVRVSGGRAPSITNIIEWKNDLVLVSKADGLYVLDVSATAPGNWKGRVLSQGIGCRSLHPQGMVRVGDDIWFVALDGIYSLNDILSTRTSTPKPVSYPINAQLVTDFLGNTDNCSTVFMVYRSGVVWVMSCRSTTPYIYRYDVRNQRWEYDRVGNGVACADAYEDTVLGSFLAADSVTLGVDYQTYMLNPQTDAMQTSPVTYQEETRGYDGEHPGNYKLGEMLEVIGVADGGSSLVIEYQLEEKGTWLTLTGSPMDFTKDINGAAATVGQVISMKYSLVGLRYKWIRFRFTDTTAYATQILGWIVYSKIENLNLSL